MGQLDTQFLPNLADEQEKSYDRSQFSKEIPSVEIYTAHTCVLISTH